MQVNYVTSHMRMRMRMACTLQQHQWDTSRTWPVLTPVSYDVFVGSSFLTCFEVASPPDVVGPLPGSLLHSHTNVVYGTIMSDACSYMPLHEYLRL
jgi:hypothetical protein